MPEPMLRAQRRAALLSALVVFAAILILWRGYPVVAAYLERFRQAHPAGAIRLAIASVSGLLCVLWLCVAKWPKAVTWTLALAAIALSITSGNVGAIPIAAALAAFTLVVGDAAARLFRGREAQRGEIAVSMAAGPVAIGISLLFLGDAHLARPAVLAAIGVAILLIRRKRIPVLWQLVRGTAREFLDRRRTAPEALWLAIITAAVSAAYVGALRPDISFDALSYHLPEARDFAEHGRVRIFPHIPETLLWHNYDTFLGGAFLAGGEKTVRFLHFLVGISIFGAASALARRLGRGGGTALVLLAIAAFPAGLVQLEETYVDLFAALCLTASAFELVASAEEPRRAWLGGFLFGGAVVTKIFALLAAPALLILLLWQRRSMRAVLGFAVCAIAALVPWFAWSQARSGFFLSPYSDPLLKGPSYLIDGTYVQPRPWKGLAPTGLGGFLKLPFAHTFRVVRISSSADAVTGFLPIALLIGATGWGLRRFALFVAAALAALVPWYLLSGAQVFFPSIRFLISLYPLYAVFTSVGLARLTDNFRGRWGAAAALSLAALSLAFPAQFFSTPYDVRVALGRISREEALSSYLPAYPLWKEVRPQDRVLFLGEWDHYHCPARYSVADVDLPVAGEDASGWRNLLRDLEITHVLYRDGQRRKPILESFESCTEEIGRHGTAFLYRLRGSPGECSGLPSARPRDGRGGTPRPQELKQPAPDAPGTPH
jgi:Dolichyl-phosphate-mannose-protein mannosyltransferase